jgi:tetratricopeptide (TPR) repeat protein
MAMLLYQVGRLNDGIEFHKRALAIDPLLPVAYASLIQAMLGAGRLQEGEALLDRAHELWPAHPLLWQTHYDFLLFSGKAAAAASFIMDPDSLPTGYGDSEVQPRLRLARAVEGRRSEDVEASIEEYRSMALVNGSAIPYSAAVFSLLGAPELTFASLERYYFNGGSFGSNAPVGPYCRRLTDWLYSPPMESARSDPRFSDLLRKTLLEEYWLRTQTIPDYRRQTV